MNGFNNIAQRIRKVASPFLVAVFLLPGTINALHIFGHDKHQACKETKLHLHEKEQDCSICELQYTPAVHIDSHPEIIFITPNYKPAYSFHPTTEKAHTPLPFCLRAPPVS